MFRYVFFTPRLYNGKKELGGGSALLYVGISMENRLSSCVPMTWPTDGVSLTLFGFKRLNSSG